MGPVPLPRTCPAAAPSTDARRRQAAPGPAGPQAKTRSAARCVLPDLPAPPHSAAPRSAPFGRDASVGSKGKGILVGLSTVPPAPPAMPAGIVRTAPISEPGPAVAARFRASEIASWTTTSPGSMDPPGLFGGVATAKPNAIFHLNTLFNADTDPGKMNLGIGAFRDDAGRPWVLPVVKAAEAALAKAVEAGEVDHEYLGIGGVPAFIDAAARVALGPGSKAAAEGRVAGVQSLSGTGALRLVADFVAKFHPCKQIYISDPTWGNHRNIFTVAGFTVNTYRYYDSSDQTLDFEGLMDDWKAAPDGAVVLVQACGHNPTGMDPTDEQFAQMVDLIAEKRFVAIVDAAYLGYVSGDVEADASAIRMMEAKGLNFFICQSFSKNFGLYNERAGCLTYVASSPAEAKAVASQIRIDVRPMYSNPPAHGARIVAKVIGDPELQKQWQECIEFMSGRIAAIRVNLVAALEVAVPGRCWKHIQRQKGMFSYTGLSKEQCKMMIEKHHIYMLDSGRISLSGIPKGGEAQVAAAMADCIKAAP